MRTQQDPRPLRPEQSLMPRAGDKRRSRLPQRERQRPGGLRGIDDERNVRLAAERRDLPDRQDIAEHIGDMGADNSVRLGLEAAPKRLERRGVVKKRAEVPDFGMTRVERTRHGVVFKMRDQNAAALRNDGRDREIQAVRGVHREDDLLRLAVEQTRQLRPAGIGHLRRALRRRMAAPADRSAGADRPRHGTRHRRRLLQARRRRIQIDHGRTSCQGSAPRRR